MSNTEERPTFRPESAPKLSRACAATGKVFAPGDKVYSVLLENEETGEIERYDYCASAWRSNARPKDALAWWSSRARENAETETKIKLAPNEALSALFVALANKPEQNALRYVLALLLARRRVLRFDYEENASYCSDPETSDSIYVYSPRDETGYLVPIVRMTEEQIAEVQARLVALLEAPEAELEKEIEAAAPPKEEETPKPRKTRPERKEPSKIAPEERRKALRAAFANSEIAEEAALAANAADMLDATEPPND